MFPRPFRLRLLQFQGVIVGASILVTLCRKKVRTRSRFPKVKSNGQRGMRVCPYGDPVTLSHHLVAGAIRCHRDVIVPRLTEPRQLNSQMNHRSWQSHFLYFYSVISNAARRPVIR